MATNQGSRAGLITSVVVLSITTVVALIFAFWYGAEKRKADEQMTDLKKRYTSLISDNALLGPDVKELEQVRADKDSGYTTSTKLWDVALGQRNRLVKIVTGKDAGPDNTAASAIRAGEGSLTSASDTIKSANTRLPSNTDDMMGAVNVLADKVKVQAETIADRDTKLQDAEKRALDAIRQKDEGINAAKDQFAKLSQDAQSTLKDFETYRTTKDATVADIEKAREDDRRTQAEALAKKDVELIAKTNDVKRLEDRARATQMKLDRVRVDVTDPMTRASEGQISGFSGKDIVYINLGQGSQVIPGLTFEVYDKAKGIPQVKDPLSDEQPAGKASIEVVRVLPDSSECRITHREPGQTIMQGDPIMNIVFNPSIKYNFVVYGKFDLDRNGVATEGDTQVMKRLVSQWGGKVNDKVGVDTDFLVIGAEPKIPAFTAEELADPVNIKKQEDAKAEMAAYQQVLKDAKELHIPILNQNRFLYFTGQADAVTR